SQGQPQLLRDGGPGSVRDILRTARRLVSVRRPGCGSGRLSPAGTGATRVRRDRRDQPAGRLLRPDVTQVLRVSAAEDPGGDPGRVALRLPGRPLGRVDADQRFALFQCEAGVAGAGPSTQTQDAGSFSRSCSPSALLSYWAVHASAVDSGI